jgi:hypothetical protein
MISTATALIRAKAIAGSGPEESPRRRRSSDRDADHRRHEPAATRSASAGSARGALRLGHHLHDLRQHGVAPTRSARMTRLPLPLSVPPMTRSPALLDRHRLAGEHRLVDARAPRPPRRRPAPSRPAARAGGRRHDVRSSGTSSSLPSSRRPPRGLRRQPEQRADRAAGLLARAQLEHLAEQHQRDDHRRRLEVDADRPVRRRGTAPGKSPGPPCRDRRCRRRRRRRRADQREHVEAAVDDRLPAAHEERPAAPQHHRRGERELDPAASEQPATRSGRMRWPPIATDHERHGERRRHQKRRVMSTSSGFSSSSAVAPSSARAPCRRSGSRPGIAHDLRVHRAGPRSDACTAATWARMSGQYRSSSTIRCSPRTCPSIRFSRSSSLRRSASPRPSRWCE